MSTFPLPANLVERQRAHPDEAMRNWIDRLPGTVSDLARRWQLELGPPYQPGGQTAWVAPVTDAAGEHLVLKVGWRHPESEHEAAALAMWGGRGTALVHRAAHDGDTLALLLERCEPGTELGQALPEEQQDEVVARLLRRLQVPAQEDQAFQRLQVMCDAWAAEHEASPAPALDPGLVREGLALFRSLPGSADRQTVLVTDLHAGNVLAARREPWLVVDPSPHVGDPTYDPLQHMLNCPGRLLADPHEFVDRMAGLCELDPQRLRLWLFARCVVESPWWPELAPVAVLTRPSGGHR